MKNVMLFCFIFQSIFLNAQTGWTEKKVENGRFYLSFPNVPSYSEGLGWTAYDKDSQVTYYISFMEVPSKNETTIAIVEKFLLPSMMEDDILVSKSYLKYLGSNAIDFLYKAKQTPILYKKGRVIVRNNNLYVLQVHYYHNDLANFDKFSKSLRFY